MRRYLVFAGYLVPIVLLVVLGVFFYNGLSRNPRHVPSPLVGRTAPQFSVPLLKNPDQQLTNADFNHQLAILNVWGTWCVACREEHPYLLELSRSADVPLFGLDWNDDRQKALNWLEKLGNPYTAVGFDGTGQAAINWGVYGAPETFLIDSDGTILFKHIAPMTPEVWRKEFLPRIREARRSSNASTANTAHNTAAGEAG